MFSDVKISIARMTIQNTRKNVARIRKLLTIFLVLGCRLEGPYRHWHGVTSKLLIFANYMRQILVNWWAEA